MAENIFRNGDEAGDSERTPSPIIDACESEGENAVAKLRGIGKLQYAESVDEYIEEIRGR